MDIIVFIIIVFIGFIIARGFTKRSVFSYHNSIYKLWIYHLFFGLIYYWYSLNNSADSRTYWIVASKSTKGEFLNYLNNGFGTPFMYVINYVPAKIFELSYFSGTLIYTLVGFIGILLFIKIAEIHIPYNAKIGKFKLFPLIFFLPNLHFWSVAVGKDTLLFFCIAIFVYGITNIKKHMLLLILSLSLSYMVRPHITLMLLISFGLAYLLKSKLNLLQKLFLLFILTVGIIVLLPKVMEYTNISEASFNSFNTTFKNQADLLNAGSGSGVDISSYPLSLKLFTFLFRPTVIDINGFLSLMAVIENVILLLLSYRVIRFRPRETFKNAPFVVKGLLIFLFVGTIAFGSSLGNMGIMLRMKNMFLPGMIIYILWALAYKSNFSILRINKEGL